jgi:hypothetical protein
MGGVARVGVRGFGKGKAFFFSTGRARVRVRTFGDPTPIFVATPRFLTPKDLENVAGGAAVIDQLFDFNGDGVRDSMPLIEILCAAEDHMASYLLKAWPVRDQIDEIGRTDRLARRHAAWVAMELAVEQRGQLLGSDGKGRYWAQYERANDYFDRLARSALHTNAQTRVGVGVQEGGAVNPQLSSPCEPRFIFAPDKRNPTGHGGF